MLDAAAEREERERRFQAAMTANLMNCLIRERVTADDLLGVPRKPAVMRTPDEMGPGEREGFAARLLEAAQRKCGKSKRRTAADVRQKDASLRGAGGSDCGSKPAAGEASGTSV